MFIYSEQQSAPSVTQASSVVTVTEGEKAAVRVCPHVCVCVPLQVILANHDCEGAAH